MTNIKIIAEVLSIGLQIGLFSKTEVIDWADQTIEALDSPSIKIIEVSLSSNDKLVDIVPKLKNVKGTYDKKLPVKMKISIYICRFQVYIKQSSNLTTCNTITETKNAISITSYDIFLF